MIIGIGNDLIDIRRIERTLKRYGDRFLNRFFTTTEQKVSERRLNRVESYAKRFAAKEACSKALGTGFRKGVFGRDIGVVNLPGGKPSIILTGGAKQRLIDITPKEYKPNIELTLTDEHPLAEAFVIISIIPKGNS